MGWSAERIEIDKTVEDFAKKHRLRLRRDECDDLFIPARRGQVFDHEDGRLGVMIFDQTPKIWGNARRSLQAAGLDVIQDGDAEGTALFNPKDARQVKIVFEVIRPYHKRQVTEAAKQLFRENLERARRSVAFA